MAEQEVRGDGMKAAVLSYFFERRSNLVDVICTGLCVQMILNRAWLGALLTFFVLGYLSFKGEEARREAMEGGAS